MRDVALVAGVTAALLAWAAPAFAFQETPAAPPEVLSVAPNVTTDPALKLQTPGKVPGSTEAPAKRGAKLFGFNVLPKLDFGLELLYSNPQTPSMELQQGTLPDGENDDLTVLGKVKRHF
jgi:hypothetical protein